MAYSTIANLNAYSRIDNDTLVPDVKFSDAEKQNAITQANSRIDYAMKTWTTFYPAATHVHVLNILRDAETYYALYILFDKKAKIIMLMNTDGNNFSTGDMNVTAPESDKKTFFVQYQALSQVYKIKAEELLGMVVPPGSDSVRSIFSFQTTDAMEI